jgi:O-acetyl-ADP-ribose deacetylase (regulator of RNase III)
MITVVRSSLAHIGDERGPEAILRSVSSNLDPDTPFGREVELAAGPQLSDRLQSLGELPLGAAVITPAGNLPAGFLIHVVVRSLEDTITPAVLRLAVTNGLRRAREWGIGSLLLPPLGTGAGNMDAQESAEIMIPLLAHELNEGGDLSEVMLLVGTEYELEVFSGALEACSGTHSAQGS